MARHREQQSYTVDGSDKHPCHQSHDPAAGHIRFAGPTRSGTEGRRTVRYRADDDRMVYLISL